MLSEIIAMSSSLSVNNQICDAVETAAEEEIKASERSFYNRRLHSKSKLGLIIKRASLCEREAEMVCRCNAIPYVVWGDGNCNRYPRGVSDFDSRGGRDFLKYIGERRG